MGGLPVDCGQVAVSVRAVVNGKEGMVLWSAPYRIDITDDMVAGENTVLQEVAHPWTNRLIGDERYSNKCGYNVRNASTPDWSTHNLAPPPSQCLSFCAYPHHKESDPLVPSGLIGAVRISAAKTVVLSQSDVGLALALGR